MFHIVIATVFCDDTMKLVVIQEFNQLSKNVFVIIHMQGLSYKDTNSNRRALKASAIN